METFEQFLKHSMSQILNPNPAPSFHILMAQAEQAYANGRTDLAYEIIQKAEPSTREESRLKAMFISQLQPESPEFLQDMNKETDKLRGQPPKSDISDLN